MTSRIRIVHIINSFEPGGAEAMLCNLVLRMDRRRFEPFVVALIDDLSVAGPLIEAGIPLATVGMRPGMPDPRAVMRLVMHLRRLRPAVIQTWMDHSNLIGAVAARLALPAPVVWGIHHSAHLPGVAKRMTLATVAACAKLSYHLPARIICCSEHSRLLYAQRGFALERMAVIPNGFDTGAFRPDPSARAAIRSELGIGQDAPLVGLVARYDPFKDHGTFLGAAAILAGTHPSAHFLLCGPRVDSANGELVSRVESLGLLERCHLLGMRRDVARIQASLDVASSSSISEAFPLAVGEAMACGVPCAATDVGDSALIIGNAGRIVPPRDPAALAEAWAELLDLSKDQRERLGRAARQRVCERFDLGAVTARYEALYDELAHRNARRPFVAVPAPLPSGKLRPIRALMIVESSAGGTGRHVLDLCEGLIRRGCDVHLISSTRRVDRMFLDRLKEIRGMRHLALPLRTSIHPTDLSAVCAIRRYLKEHGPFDVIHGHSSKGGALGRLAALGTGIPAFYTLHGLIMMDPGLARWKWLFYLSIELGLSLRTSRVIAVSPEEARAAVRLGLGESRVILIPNGVSEMKLAPRNEARAAMGVDEEAVVIGFIGRLVEQKAPQVLIEAFAAAARAVPHARLAMVGSGPLEDALRKQAMGLGVAGKIHWLGERDARGVLAGFDLFALSSRKEGLPYVVLEAMAAGLPVVATESAGVEILVKSGENGTVVPPDDAGAFGAALIALASDPRRLAAFGEASRVRVAAFTVADMVDRTLAAYICAAQPQPAAAQTAAKPAERPAAVEPIVAESQLAFEASSL